MTSKKENALGHTYIYRSFFRTVQIASTDAEVASGANHAASQAKWIIRQYGLRGAVIVLKK